MQPPLPRAASHGGRPQGGRRTGPSQPDLLPDSLRSFLSRCTEAVYRLRASWWPRNRCPDQNLFLHLSFRLLTQRHLPFKNLLSPPASFFSRVALVELPRPLEAFYVTALLRLRACAMERPGQMTGGGLVCKELGEGGCFAVTSAPAPRVLVNGRLLLFGTGNRALPTPERVGETSSCIRRAVSQRRRNAGAESPDAVVAARALY